MSPTLVTGFLDRALEGIDGGRVEEGLDELYEGAVNRRAGSSPQDWRSFVAQVVRPHAVLERIHLDPIARRSFEKPRGYAGDAVLLDYIYGLSPVLSGDARAAEIHAYGRTRPACLGVRRRRRRIAAWIDEASARADRPLRVLSVASGHLREAELSAAFREGRIEEYVALDSDAESCAQLQREKPAVRVVNAPFTALYRDPSFSDRFDLIYSAGLYDYLEASIAARLSARLFDLLAPGGRLLLTNFLVSNADAAYMEAFMDWTLIHRDADEIAGFASRIPAERIAARRAWTDAHLAVGYLELERP